MTNTSTKPALSFKEGLKLAGQAFASTLLASGFSPKGTQAVTSNFVKVASARQSRIDEYVKHFGAITKAA